MAKELTEREKIDIIKGVLEQNGLSYEEFTPLLSTNLDNSDTIFNGCDKNGCEYSKILSLFEPKKENINISHIVGLNYKRGTFLNSLLNIYRSDIIYNNLGKFNFEEFNKTLDKSNFSLIEKDNRYYVSDDGNHRVLLMLFQYCLELVKLYKQNASEEELLEFQNRMTINVPVYHIDNHDLDMLNKLYDNSTSPIKEATLKGDFLHKSLGKNLANDRYLQYNKETANYDLCYKGVTKKNLNSKQVIEYIDYMNDINTEYDFVFDNKSKLFSVASKHIGVKNVSFENINEFNDYFSFYKFPEFGVDYFISADAKNNNLFSLDTACKDFGDINVDYKKVSKLLKESSDVLCSNRVDNDDEEVFTHYNYLSDLHFENITLHRALSIVRTLEKLNNIIAPKR